MASSSSSPRNWVYDVFPSFSGEDVRVKFLGHFLKEFERKLITIFKDNAIERGQSLDPVLKQAIKDSKIAVVIFSKNYASSTWCLNELLEIVQCKKECTVIPVFYDLDPSHVRKQTGDFGEIFKKTCEKQSEEVKNQWKDALTNVANIFGYHSATWGTEAKLIENIVDDVLKKLLLTTSNVSGNFVGIDDHIAKIGVLLQLNSEISARMIGIWGSSGIGKTTIARILFNRLSRHFQGSAFIDSHDLYESMKSYSRGNPDDYNFKLHLQEVLLSKILHKEGIRVDHLGAVRQKLNHQKVLIIIDDLDNQVVLDALVGQTDWFGRGSRIIVITKDKQFLRAHWIDCIYEVGLPSDIQALQMFSQYAFRTDSPRDGFMEIASEVASRAGKLPLGLQVLGSCLRGRELKDWVNMLPMLRDELDGKIEKTLIVSYNELNSENYQRLFRQIACLFNGEKVDDINLLRGDNGFGLEYLIDKSLVHVRNNTIEMHLLLQEMGKKIVRAQSQEAGEREFLMDSKDICKVLKDNTGTKNVLGIALDMDENDELHIPNSAFKRMSGLLSLNFYDKQKKGVRWHLGDGFDYLPSSLRLLSWDKYPLICMPSKFYPESLVKLQLQESKLENLWEGAPQLRGLKDLDLQRSKGLKKIPDLSGATNLRTLNLGDCSSLMELPSSISYLNKLEKLVMSGCSNLEILPSAINLESLNRLDLNGCSRLRRFPDISTNFIELILDGTAIDVFPSKLRLENLQLLSMRKMKSDILQPITVLMDMVCPSLRVLFLSDIPSLVDLPSSFKNLHKLIYLEISLEILPTDINFESLGALDLSGCSRLRSFPNISTHISYLYLNGTGIEEVPWWIENFSMLRSLLMNGCDRLQSVSLHISKLKYLDKVDFSDCWALNEASLNGSPSAGAMTTAIFQSKLPFQCEASSSLPSDNIRTVDVNFFNCSSLNQEALIQNQLAFCKSMVLSGEKVPSYFTTRTTGTSKLPIYLLHTGLSPIFKFKACAVVDCISVPDTHDIFSIQVCCLFIDELRNPFKLATQPLYFSNLKLGSQLVIFEFSILLNEEKARVAEPNDGHSKLIGCGEMRVSQVYHENKLPGLDLEVPRRHEVQFKLKEWGLEGPIQNKVPLFTLGSVTRAPKQNAAQGQQFQQNQCMEMFQNNAQVQGTNFGQANFPAKLQFNNFQQGYQAPIQTQANAPTVPQESKTDLLLQQLMESQKQIIEGQKQNTKETKDLNVKLEGICNDFNGKFESLVAHVRKLEVQVTQTAEADIIHEVPSLTLSKNNDFLSLLSETVNPFLLPIRRCRSRRRPPSLLMAKKRRSQLRLPLPPLVSRADLNSRLIHPSFPAPSVSKEGSPDPVSIERSPATADPNLPSVGDPSLDLPSSEPGSTTQLLETESSTPVDSTPLVSNRSWADLVKGPSEKMAKKGTPFVLESGELCVKIPNEVIIRNNKRWEPFIIGQFHGNLPSPGALHAIFNGIWSNRLRDITASKLGPRSVLIQIPNSETRKRVHSQGIWHIEGQTMFVADWEPGLNPSMPELTEVPVWLEFRGVPPHFFSIEGFEHVAGMLGHPIFCHPSTINMTNMEVGKVFTIINPLKPLPEAVNVQFATGEIHRVDVSCPWLPPICSHCQQVGHSIRRCPTAPITCLGCNSTGHQTESYLRGKKPKDNATKEKKFRKEKSVHEETPFVVKRKKVLPKENVVVDEVRDNPLHDSNASSKHAGKMVADIGLGSPKFLPKVSTKSKSKKSFLASTSRCQANSSNESEQSEDAVSDSLSQDQSSSAESSSEDLEVSEEEESPFIEVLSKKQRRQVKTLLGKSPKSTSNHWENG